MKIDINTKNTISYNQLIVFRVLTPEMQHLSHFQSVSNRI